MMHTKKKRAAALLAALAAAAGVAVIAPVASATDQPLGNATAPFSNSTMSPTSGSIATNFSITLPAGSNICPGDSASGGYRVNTFIANRSVDVSTLSYGASGPVAPAPTDFVRPLRNLSNANIININTAPTTGVVINASQFSWTAFAATVPPNGEYKIGVACTLGGVTTRYWQQPITVRNATASTFDWIQGWAPAAPTGVTAAGGNQSITGSFSAVTSIPAVSGYSVTATPVGGGASVAGTVTGTTFEILGLVNGTAYNVVVTATNAVGAGAGSAPVVATPSLPGVPFTPTVSAPSGASPITVSWTAAPATSALGGNLTGYTVTFVGSPAIAPVTVAAPATSTVVSGAAGDSYTVSVVGNYDNGQTTGVGSTALVFVNAQILVQDITVTRPAGALVLTQRCGAFGSAEAYTDPWLGTLPLIPATPGADPTGGSYPIAPRTDGTAPNQVTGPITPGNGVPAAPAWTTVLPPWASATLDTENFDEYPYPTIENPATPGEPVGTGIEGEVNPFYPTRCGINLGTARLITTGPAAGQYFWAQGRLNQITVVNTQNIDNGWTLNGRMSNFVSTTDAGDFFSGNLLGWNPEVTWDSGPNLDGYDMTVTPGNVRQPVATASTTGLGDASNSTNVLPGQSLATTARLPLVDGSQANSLGMAVIDARIRLFIPVTADAGVYKGTLTFTAV